jgi:hypothetical protein
MSQSLAHLTRFTYTEKVPIDHKWRRDNLRVITFRLRELMGKGHTLPHAQKTIEPIFGIKFL